MAREIKFRAWFVGWKGAPDCVEEPARMVYDIQDGGGLCCDKIYFDEFSDISPCSKMRRTFDSISNLNDEWEDYEEPTTYYYISDFGAIREGDVGKFVEDEESRREIGNYFETKEDAEQAVEKLKAWKRLKDKGFEFGGLKEDYTRINGNYLPARNGRRYLQFNKSEDEEWLKENWDDLDLLFGGEE